MTASSEVTITVAAPAELGAATERVTVEVPDGFRVTACEHADGFQCSHATAVDPERTIVAWQSVGPVRSLALRGDRFPFRMRTTDKPGAYPIPVTQFYADGSAARSAPVLEVTATRARAAAATGVTTVRPTAVRTLSVTATTRVPRPPIAAVASPRPDNPVVASERGASTAPDPLMISLGIVATIAAGGVFWLRRRITALDP